MQETGLLLANAGNSTSEIMLNVTVCGLVIVFAVLILLVAVIGIFGSLMSKNKKKPANPQSAPTPTNVVKTQTVKPENNDDDQVIAVITAAVYSYYADNTSVRPVIKAIRPASSSRSGWQQAGMRQNMRSL
ncbi:MAG: OadG family protein [Oscillospiraceae bacterium]|nr:OadG family protein [Candidatus Equicaccousia limihippi]